MRKYLVFRSQQHWVFIVPYFCLSLGIFFLSCLQYIASCVFFSKSWTVRTEKALRNRLESPYK